MGVSREQLQKAVDNKILDLQQEADVAKRQADEDQAFQQEIRALQQQAQVFNETFKDLLQTLGEQYSDELTVVKTWNSIPDDATDREVKAIFLALSSASNPLAALNDFQPDFGKSWQAFVQSNPQRIRNISQSLNADVDALMTDEVRAERDAINRKNTELMQKQQQMMMAQMMQPPAALVPGDTLVLAKEPPAEEGGEWLVVVMPVKVDDDYKVSLAKTFQADLSVSLHVRSEAGRTLAEEFNAPSLFVPAGQEIGVLHATCKADGGNATIDVVGTLSQQGFVDPVLIHETLYPVPEPDFGGPGSDLDDLFGGPRGGGRGGPGFDF